MATELEQEEIDLNTEVAKHFPGDAQRRDRALNQIRAKRGQGNRPWGLSRKKRVRHIIYNGVVLKIKWRKGRRPRLTHIKADII